LSTRRLPAADRRRTEVHRGRAVRQEQHSNRQKEPQKTPRPGPALLVIPAKAGIQATIHWRLTTSAVVMAVEK